MMVLVLVATAALLATLVCCYRGGSPEPAPDAMADCLDLETPPVSFVCADAGP